MKPLLAQAGEDVPRTPLPLLLGAERTAIVDDADFFEQSPDELLAHLRRLAVALQLRGLTEAPADELAAITGQGAPEAEAMRCELVQRALLQDRLGLVAFPSRVRQEALCADAILASPDPVRTVREIAVAEVAGDEILRGDMDQVLDFVWESAPPDVRAGLRELDALRFARTQTPDDVDGARAALDILWEWFERRRIWLTDDHGTRQVRGAAKTVERLLKRQPELAEQRRERLVDTATNASLATSRGNAIEWLSHLPVPADEQEAMDWMAERIQDENDVVRRNAAHAAVWLKIRSALPAVRERLRVDTDESAIDELGYAAFELATDDEVPELARELYATPLAWRHLGRMATERISLDTGLDLVDGPHPGRESWRELVAATLEKEPDDSAWTENQVETLCRAAVAHGMEFDEIESIDRLAALAGRYPPAALRGAEQGAERSGDRLHMFHLFFLRELPDELLDAALSGPLREAVSPIVELRRNPPSPEMNRPANPGAHPDRAEEPSPNPDRIPLADALDRELYTPEQPPIDRRRWPVDSLSDIQAMRLRELIEEWWPEDRVAESIRATPTGWELDASVSSVVLAAAAVDMPLPPERWRDVFASGAITFDTTMPEWLSRNYRPECLDIAADVIRGLSDGRHLYMALSALPELDADVAQAVSERLPHVTDLNYLSAVAERLGDLGQLQIVQEAYERDGTRDRAHVFARVLARHGDVNAQVALIEALIATAQAGEHLDPALLDWYPSARDERLLEPLGELLGYLDDAPHPMDRMQQAVRMALSATRQDGALAVYDRLVDDPDRPWRAFQWYPRAELAAILATERVLARLPATPAGVLDVLRELGFEQ